MSSTFTPVAHVGEFGLIDRLETLLGVSAPDGDLLCAIGDDAGELVPVDEPRALADALVRCLVDPPRVSAMRARERFEQSFTPDAVVAAMRRFYETALSAGAA